MGNAACGGYKPQERRTCKHEVHEREHEEFELQVAATEVEAEFVSVILVWFF